MTVDLSGKKALITGASRGIGAAVAKAYAKAGAHVILLARTVGALEELDDEIRALGGQATLVPQDLRNLDALDTLGPALAEKFGGLDIFVGNAGMLSQLAPLSDVETREWNDVLTTNLSANFRLIRTLDPLLKASPAGRVILTSSGLGEMVMAYWGPYSVSKAALNMLGKMYAAETEKTSIRVNLVDPGIVDTEMLAEAFPGGFTGEAKKPENVVQTYLDLASNDCTKHGEIVQA